MSDAAISITGLGKMFKLHRRSVDKVLDLLGLRPWLFWRKEAAQEFWALRNVDLEVRPGERLGIIGRNGAGKTTLLKIILGSLMPTEGRVRIRGRLQAMMELGTGFHPDFTGRENIHAALAYQGLSAREIRATEDDIIDFTELEEFIEQPIRVYSAGMYTRLAFAVATAVRPEILIIDEILGAGDAAFVAKCAARLRGMTERDGATLLFVSHSMPSVIEMCNRSILLQRGTVTHEGTPLHVSKVYNALIREEEELFLRAREYRLRKRDYRALRAVGPDHEPLLFRLTTDGDRPGRHHFYRFALEGGGGTLAEVRVGGPMDNDLTALNRVIDGPGTDWGASLKDGPRLYRTLQTGPASVRHAPLQLCLPVAAREGRVELAVEARTDPAQPVHLDLWQGDRYERVVTLPPGEQSLRLPLNDHLPAPEERPGPAAGSLAAGGQVLPFPEGKETLEAFQEKLSVYGNQKVVFREVDLVNRQGKSCRVYEVGDCLHLRMTIEAREPVPSVVLVCSVLTTDGRPIGQVYCPGEKLGLADLDGEKVVHLVYDPLRYGAGEYMASLGIFIGESYDLSTERENPSYCVLDRALFFKVRQPAGMGKGIGACAAPVLWRCGDREHRYDPALDHVERRAA